MSANLYDLLDVDESATSDEIRAAWKAVIADLEPDDRRFRAYNDAAGVLLDDERRAAYDATLAEERAEEEPVDDAPAPVASPTSTVSLTKEPTPAPADDAADGPTADAAESEPTRAASPGPRTATLVVAGVAAVLAIALAIWVFTLDGVRAEASPQDVAERAAVQEEAAESVESAAEQMVAPVLSYNHKTMEADLDRLQGYLTQQMADKQAKAWPELTKEAVAQEVVVEAAATGTALTRVDPDGKRATVVVFIDQYVQKKGAQPFVLRMWATMSLVRADGSEGRWLLDDLCTDDSCG